MLNSGLRAEASYKTNKQKENSKGSLFYSLIPPLKISLIKYFLPSKNTPITGKQHITEYAVSAPQSVISLKLPLKHLIQFL